MVCIVILCNGSMSRARREVRLQRDCIHNQIKVNRVAIIQNYNTCLCFCFSYIGILMTLLMWVNMEILVSVLLEVYLDGGGKSWPFIWM